MAQAFESTREVILRTENWSEATRFYSSVLGLPIAYEAETMIGFECGAFRLYVEKGKPHAPVFEFLVPDLQVAKRRLTEAGCAIVEEDASLPAAICAIPSGLFSISVKLAPNRIPLAPPCSASGSRA